MKLPSEFIGKYKEIGFKDIVALHDIRGMLKRKILKGIYLKTSVLNSSK